MKTISVKPTSDQVIERQDLRIEVSTQQETNNVVSHFKEILCVKDDSRTFDYDSDQEQTIEFGNNAIYFIHMTGSQD